MSTENKGTENFFAGVGKAAELEGKSRAAKVAVDNHDYSLAANLTGELAELKKGVPLPPEPLSAREEELVDLVINGGLVYQMIEKGEISREELLSTSLQLAIAEKLKDKLIADKDDVLGVSLPASIIRLRPEIWMREDFQQATKIAVINRLQAGKLDHLNGFLYSLPVDQRRFEDNTTQALVSRRFTEYVRDWGNWRQVMLLLRYFPVPDEVLRNPENVEGAITQMACMIHNWHFEEAQEYERLAKLKPAEMERAVIQGLGVLAKLGAANQVKKVLDIWPIDQKMLHGGDKKLRKEAAKGIDINLVRPVGLDSAPEDIKILVNIFGFKEGEYNNRENRRKAEGLKTEIDEAVARVQADCLDNPAYKEGTPARESWVEYSKRLSEARKQLVEFFQLN